DPERKATREGVVHARGVRCRETLNDVHPDLPAISQPSLEQLISFQRTLNRPDRAQPAVQLSQRNTPALFGARLIDEVPEEVILTREKVSMFPNGRALRLADGRIGRFGWKAQKASLGAFVRVACASELGLGNPDHPQPRPLHTPNYPERGLDLTA